MKLLGKIYRRFIKGDWKTKRLFLEAFLLSALVRFLMLFIQYNKFAGRMGKRGTESDKNISEKDEVDALYITHIVKTTCTYTPWESLCFVQALSSKWMLKKRGISSTIYFGVKDDLKNGGIMAHAWLRVGDKILTGWKGHKNYKVVNYYS